MIGDRHRDRFSEFQLAFFNKPVHKLSDMQHLQLRSQIRIEPLDPPVAVGTGRHYRLDSGILPGFQVIFGILGKLSPVAHIVYPASTAVLFLTHDAYIYSGLAAAG